MYEHTIFFWFNSVSTKGIFGQGQCFFLNVVERTISLKSLSFSFPYLFIGKHCFHIKLTSFLTVLVVVGKCQNNKNVKRTFFVFIHEIAIRLDGLKLVGEKNPVYSVRCALRIPNLFKIRTNFYPHCDA